MYRYSGRDLRVFSLRMCARVTLSDDDERALALRW